MTSSMTGSRGPTGMSTGQSSTGKNFREKIPKGYKAGTLQQFTPEQLELFQQLFSHVGPDSYLSRLAGGDESLFSEIEEPALRQFSQLQGGLASRFSGMGGLGARRSSGFQNTSNQAASDFAKDLQGKRQDLMRQALQDLRGFSSELLSQKPYENFLVKKQNKEPFWKQALGIISPVGGDIASGGTENTQNFLKILSSLG